MSDNVAARLSTHLKTLLTLGVLAVLLLVGLTWGWSAMTTPFPHTAETKVCVPTTVEPGDRVAAPKVTVSVYNASDRVGLADRTMASFEAQGFGAGKVANAPKGTTVNMRPGLDTRAPEPRRQAGAQPAGPEGARARQGPDGAGRHRDGRRQGSTSSSTGSRRSRSPRRRRSARRRRRDAGRHRLTAPPHRSSSHRPSRPRAPTPCAAAGRSARAARVASRRAGRHRASGPYVARARSPARPARAWTPTNPAAAGARRPRRRAAGRPG